MLRIFKSWRSIRWLAFLISFGVDSYAFYAATPFTPRSFAASGTLALLLFVIFLEIALHMRGQGRIRSSIDEHDRIRYQVGRHTSDLFKRIHAHQLATLAIWLPVLLALATTGYIFWVAVQLLPSAPDRETVTQSIAYACGGYLPLLIAIPFVLEHVSEWTSWQYVIVADRTSGDPLLLISHGVLDYDLETISLERTVTTHVHQSFWDSLFAYGDVELRETGGGSGERIEAVWRPRKFAKEIRAAIGAWRRHHAPEED